MQSEKLNCVWSKTRESRCASHLLGCWRQSSLNVSVLTLTHIWLTVHSAVRSGMKLLHSREHQGRQRYSNEMLIWKIVKSQLCFFTGEFFSSGDTGGSRKSYPRDLHSPVIRFPIATVQNYLNSDFCSLVWTMLKVCVRIEHPAVHHNFQRKEYIQTLNTSNKWKSSAPVILWNINQSNKYTFTNIWNILLKNCLIIYGKSTWGDIFDYLLILFY